MDQLDRIVAVKVLPSHLAANPLLKERFEREARAVAALNHPNILTIHDVGEDGGVDFLVTELLEGELDRAERYAEAALREIERRLDKNEFAPQAHQDRAEVEVQLAELGYDGRYGVPGNYLVGANIAGFVRVANATLDQGLV